MSDTTADPQIARLQIDKMIADIERAQEETRKFVREAHKLQSEAAKLDAEAMKLHRDRGLAPWLAVVGLIGGLLAIANLATRFPH